MNAAAVATTETTETKQTPPAPKRNPRGTLGVGTRSTRVKAMWRYAMKGQAKHLTLRAWVRKAIKQDGLAEEDKADLTGWLNVKTHIRTPEQKKLMKEAKQRKRPKPKKPSKDRRRVKGNSGKR